MSPDSRIASPEPVATVLVVDRRPLARLALRRLVEGVPGVRIVGEAHGLVSTLEGIRSTRPEVIVVGPEPCQSTTADVVLRLRSASPRSRIVVVVRQGDAVTGQRALLAGAAVAIPEQAVQGQLAGAVRSAAGLPDDGGPLPRLSRRESEVLRLIALGHTSREIAAALHLSERTIESHRASLHRKLGAKARADLVRHALRRGLLRDV